MWCAKLTPLAVTTFAYNLNTRFSSIRSPTPIRNLYRNKFHRVNCVNLHLLLKLDIDWLNVAKKCFNFVQSFTFRYEIIYIITYDECIGFGKQDSTCFTISLISFHAAESACFIPWKIKNACIGEYKCNLIGVSVFQK